MTTAPSPARYSLGAYLAFAFSLLSILLTLILTAVIERSASGQVEQSIGANLAELAHQTASRLDRSMYERYREVGLMAGRLAGMPATQVRSELDALQESYPYYAWIGATDAQGKVLAATRGLLAGQDVSQRPWFTNALQGKYVGDVHEALLLARLLGGDRKEPPRFVDVAFPLIGPGGNPTGVLGAHLSWEWAQDIQRTIFVALDKSREVEPLIISSTGGVLLGPPSLQGQPLQLPSLSAASGGQTGHRVERWPDGQDYLVGYSRSEGYSPYPGLGWTVLVRQPLDEAYEPVRALQWRVFASGLAIALLFSLLGWYAAKAITRPLLELARFAQRGDAAGAAQVGPLRGYREVGQLGESLNAMLESLRRKEGDLRELNASLERRVEERTAELSDAFRQVQRNEQRIQTIIESAQDAFIGMDFQGRITDWNTQAQKLFGWTREEAIGRPLARTLLPARYAPAAEAALAQFHQTGSAEFLNQRMERVMIDRHGREIQVEAKLGLVDTEHLKLFSGFVHDISQRKEVERLKSEFISTVSHELRTPLTAIYGSLSLLDSGAAGALPDDAAQLVAMSVKSCERLVRLINDVLDVEKIDAGLLNYERTRQPVRAMIEQSLADIRPYALQRGVEVHLAGPAPDAQVLADPDRIVQVLVNLLSNAVKFSPPGGRVDVVATLHPGAVRIAVADGGPGIPPAFRARIFERFAQADGSDRRQSGGTGLGLNICRSIVLAHGGSIDFASEPGVRTEFYFELPLA